MNNLVKILLVFLALTGATTLLLKYNAVVLGNIDFWNTHGVLFLICITIFPRLTLLFSSVAFGGLLWWLTWLFTPRFLVAVLATLAYWNTNKVLVIISWLIAMGGESSEKYYVHRKTFKRKYQNNNIEGKNKSTVIEADYYEKKD